MARLVEIFFDTRRDSSDNGKIVLNCENTGTPGTTWDFYLQMVSPSGEVLKSMPDTPDLSLDGEERNSVSMDIPLDSNGEYLEGDYVVAVRRTNGVQDTTVEVTFAYESHVNPDNVSGTAVVDATIACLTGRITATDETPYTPEGLTLEERTLSIIPPAIDPQDAAESSTGTVTLVVGYTNVTYQVKLAVEYSWLEDDLGNDITSKCTGSLIVYKEVFVDCEDGGICGSLDCIAEELEKIQDQACEVGGFTRLPQSQKDKIAYAMMNLSMAKMQYDCGDVEAANAFVEKAKEGIKCGCGCGSSTTPTPRPYTPPATAPADSDPGTPELQYWEESQSGGGSVWTPLKEDSANYDAIVTAKGTGSLRGRTAGNARGQYAVDLQLTGSADSQVASGNKSVAVGSGNRVSGADSQAIGTGNVVTGANSFAAGKSNSSQDADTVAIGNGNNVTTAESVAIGKSNTVDSDDSVAVGIQNIVTESYSVTIGKANTANEANAVAIGDTNSIDEINSIAIGSNNDGDGQYNTLIGTGNAATADGVTAIGDGNAASAPNTTMIGSALSADADGAFVTGKQATAHLKRQKAHGINDENLQTHSIALSRTEQAGNSAFILTAGGGNTLDLALPAGNHVWGCRLLLTASIVETDGGFAVGDTFLCQKQFAVSKVGSTIALQGTVQSVGTDVAAASMSALVVDVSVNDTTDQIEIEITPPVGMGAGDKISVFASLEVLQIKLP